MKKYTLYSRALIIIGIIILINLITNEFFIRLDFTENKEFTLSQATKDILSDLKEPITIKAYFSSNTPPQIQKIKRDFQDLLVEYATYSGGKIAYKFIDPSSEQLEKEALENGIVPININVREKNEMKVQKAYIGALTLFEGMKREQISLLQGGSLEYAISSAIKKTSNKNKISIGLVNTGVKFEEIYQSFQELSVLYNINTIDLSSNVDTNMKTLIILRPNDSLITKEKLNKIDIFFKRGGRLFLGYNNVDSDLKSMDMLSRNKNITEWLKTKNIRVNDNAILDMKCASLTVQQQQGAYILNNQIPFPYIFFIENFSEHPISKNLSQVGLNFVSSIDILDKKKFNKLNELMYTSDNAEIENMPINFDLEREWNKNSFTKKRIPIGISLEGGVLGSDNAKMVLIPDGRFPIGNPQNLQNSVSQDNVRLFVNSVDWLSDDTGLIDLRTKITTIRTIKNISDSKKEFLKYLNFLLPLILVILGGIIRFQYKKRESLIIKSQNYE